MNPLAIVFGIASIVGALLSIFSWRKTHKLHRSYLQRARLPKIKRELRQYSNQLATHVNESKANNVVLFPLLSRCKSSLKNIQELFRGPISKSAGQAAQSIFWYKFQHVEKPSRFTHLCILFLALFISSVPLYKVYSDLEELLQHIRIREADLQ